MKIDLIIASGIKTNREFHGKTVVVIDVLRATSSIITALANGCLDLLPVAEPVDAAFICRQIGENCLAGGERNGLKIPGFDLGNSPLEYTPEKVSGKRVVLCTTNGTKALKEAESAAEILIGAFLNIGKIISYLKNKKEIVLFCAGKNGEPGLEDLLCAGLIIERLIAEGIEVELTDAAYLGLIVYRQLISTSGDLTEAVYQAKHAQYLASIGFAADISYCVQVDTHPYLVSFKSGRVIIEREV